MKEILLSNGMSVFVDDDDYEKISIYKWRLNKDGYAVTSMKIDGKWKHVMMHRMINNTPDGMYTDHIDGNKVNNRKNNLRTCTFFGNNQNKRKQKSDNNKYKSKYKGIEVINGVGWRIRVCANGKTMINKLFSNEIAAANAYNYYAQLYHGEFASLNEVEHIDWRQYIKASKSSSQYKGVHASCGKWRARVWNKNTKSFINAGIYDTELEAALAYDRIAYANFGNELELNFPYRREA
jgi:hypothetical protein